MEKNCTICNNIFMTKSNRSQYCSKECKSKNSFNKNQERLTTGDEGIDYIVDKWNGYATPRLYGAWIRAMHPGKTTADYLIEFPGSDLCCEKDKHATTVNSGKHMKDAKYRKMASDAIKGANNPNHKTKTTKEERQSRSPFSKKFLAYESESEAMKFQKEHCSKGISSNNIDYWLNKGYSLEEAKELLKERQTTFTLEKCIIKYGEELGLVKFNERQTKWSAKIEEKYKNGEFTRFCKNNWSKVELEFIHCLVDKLKLTTDEYYSAINGRQFFRYFKTEQITKSYDFVIGKKIIEFNGDYWHCNPSIYEADYFNKSIQMKSREKWKHDSSKIKLIEAEGYHVLTIWEKDWVDSPKQTIKKCIEFIND